MSQRFGKWLKYVGNGLDTWGTSQVFEKRHKLVANNLNILNMAQICGKGLSILETALQCWKVLKNLKTWHKYVGNVAYMWAMA